MEIYKKTLVYSVIVYVVALVILILLHYVFVVLNDSLYGNLFTGATVTIIFIVVQMLTSYYIEKRKKYKTLYNNTLSVLIQLKGLKQLLDKMNIGKEVQLFFQKMDNAFQLGCKADTANSQPESSRFMTTTIEKLTEMRSELDFSESDEFFIKKSVESQLFRNTTNDLALLISSTINGIQAFLFSLLQYETGVLQHIRNNPEQGVTPEIAALFQQNKDMILVQFGSLISKSMSECSKVEQLLILLAEKSCLKRQVNPQNDIAYINKRMIF
ncbi:MAG: hypothetical protein IKH19_03795 [Muribaculaceae bacterium]|nr:hypothetical protein [Muribaculaceae bacterium]